MNVEYSPLGELCIFAYFVEVLSLAKESRQLPVWAGHSIEPFSVKFFCVIYIDMPMDCFKLSLIYIGDRHVWNYFDFLSRHFKRMRTSLFESGDEQNRGNFDQSAG